MKSKMKKFLVFISLVFLILGFSKIDYAATASPETKVFVDPETSRERPGGTFTIDIKVADVTDLIAFFFDISWNTSILEWVGTEYGGFLGSREEVMWNFSLETGTLLIICIMNFTLDSLPLNGVNGSGTLANITFEVETWGETRIEFTEAQLGVLSPEEGIAPVEDLEIVSGYFTNLEGPPVASFTYSPLSPNIGETVSFDASASYDFGGYISSYTWDFGDGTPPVTENDPVATHVFLTAKTYSVTLTVTDDVGESGNYTTELNVFVPKTIYVNANNIEDLEENGSQEHPFDMIQEGVDAASWGDTVQVASGTYFERVTINVGELKLVGENRHDTVIDGSGTGNVVTVLASGVSISDFTIQNGEAGIYQSDCTGVTIHDNKILNNGAGIDLRSSNDNEIRDNVILNNGVGIDLRSSNNSVILSNNVTSNTNKGISLNCSHDNTVIDNIVSNNSDGIILSNSSNNTFFSNTVENNNVGVSIDKDSGLNKFHHNNFTGNVQQAVDNASNIWDDGYPSGGNYWSNYNGTDLYSGPYQNETGSDGIGDTPYVIDADNQDTYPLTPDWKDTENPTANAGEDRTVNEDTLVTFDGSASNDNIGIMSYVWTFTDVTAKIKSAKPTCTYIFETPGIYLVTLNVTDVGDNWATDNVTITVLDITQPVANAGQNQTVNEDAPVIFDGSASSDNIGITAYTWTFTDVTTKTLTGEKSTYTFEMPGIYTITLNVTDAARNWAIDTIVITVLDITSPIANAGQNQTVTVGTTVIFNASDSSDNVGIISYEWDFGDNSSLVTENNPVTNHTYTELGNFNVTLTVRDEAGNSDTAYVVVKVTDLASITILVTLLIISAATTVIVGALAGIAMLIRRHRSTKPSKNSDLPATDQVL